MTKVHFHLRQFRLLLLVLLCALFSLPLSAQKAYVAESEGGSTLTFYYDAQRQSRSGDTWGIDEKKKNNIYGFEAIPAWAGTYNSRNYVVTKVVFDASFKDFRPTTTKGWFYYLLKLTTIEGLENLNTSEVKDMSGMFYFCSGLTSLNLSNFNTSAVTNMGYMFSCCSSLTSLNLSNFNTSAVTNMSWMFENCWNLKRIFNTATWRCEKSQYMFEGCTQLKGAVKYDESKVDATMANPETGYFTDSDPRAYVQQSEDQDTLTFYYDVNRAFRSGKTWGIDEKNKKNNWSLPAWAGTDDSPNKVVTKVVFDASFKNLRPTTTNSWFYNLEALTTIEGLENLNTSAVTDMRWMFYGCSGLKELNLSNFNTSKVTDMSYMFSWCTSLTSLNLSNFNTSAVTDMRGMFRGCSGLTSLNLSKFNTSAVRDMSYMFSGCSGLKTILNTNTWLNAYSQDMFKGCTQLKGAVKYDASKLDVTMANPTTGYFTDPNRKAYVLLSEDQHTLTFFYDANRRLRLTSGIIWGIDEKKNKNSNNNETVPAWAGTNDTPNNVVTKVVFDASFKDFLPLTTYSWFYNLKALTTIEGLENLNTSEVTNMSGMFSNCSGLTSLNLSNFNTSAVTDMSRMFYGCSSLKTIFNTQTWRYNLSENMFYGCTQLRGAVKYDASKLGITMADPITGYFTDPNRKVEAYVQQSEDEQTLTFYYDNNRKFRSGKTWEIDENSSSSNSAWAGTYWEPNKWIKKVVFDASFKGFLPLTTNSWFSYLKALTTIKGLENLNTSAVTDMGWMFAGCSGLTSLNLSNFNTSKVTNMNGMFNGCSGLTSLSLSNFNTSKVTDMREMFSGCSGLKELNVSNFNTSKVTDMREMFSGCSGLKELNVSNFNTSKVTDMRGIFYGCSGLKELNVSNFNTSSVTNMGEMFYRCSSLTSLNVSNFNTSAVTDMSYMFSGYRGVTSLNLSNFNTSAVTNMRGMFSNSGLTALNLSNFNTSAVKDMSDMFRECFGLRTLNVSNFNTSAVTNMSAMFRDCSSLMKLKISNFNTSAVTNMSEMFYRCSGLTELNLSNFNTSKVTNMNEMFRSCSGLTELNLSNFNTSSVPSTRRMFYDCSSLKTIFNTNTWRCGDSQDMFSGCRELKGAVEYSYSKVNYWMANPATGYFTDLNSRAYVCQSEGPQTLTFYYDNNRKSRSGKTWDIDEKSSGSKPAWAGTDISPDNVVTKVKFDASFKDFHPTTTNYWFYNLEALTTIEGLENLNTSAVTDMGDMFSGCYRLISLNLSNFNTSAVTDMGWMFSGCSGLKELNLSSFNTSAVTDMNGMFFGCSSLKTIFNPNTWRCEESQDMFDGCTQLKGAVKYDDKKLDATMANPATGYFTDPNRQLKAYVLQSEDQHTLTFYYDNNRKLRSGKTWDINEKSSSSKPIWAGTYSTANKAVTKVVFDASFKDFRPKTTNSWFSYLSALTTIEGLENLNTSAVTDMSEMFRDCSSLTSLNLSNFNTAKVSDMRAMFANCSGLKELNLFSFNTSAVTNMNGMFYGCSGLKEMNLSNFNTAGVIYMRWMFENCSSLKTIINTQTWRCEQSQDMFKGCTQLKGAVKYDESKVDATMANPTTGYFSQKLPSAIGRVVFDDNNATQIYNLQGKRVNANQRHLPAGFYIVNGKKVYLNEKP